MKGQLGVPLTLLGLILATSLVVTITAGSALTPGTVYTAPQVQAGLADQPQAWVGRTVRVRGMAEPCPYSGGTAYLWQCADDPLILVSDSTDRGAVPLPLSPSAPNALLAVLRNLPLLHDLAFRSPAVPVFAPERFQVQVRSVDVQTCGGRSPCYEAVLLDATP
jgi:hypothetical protein